MPLNSAETVVAGTGEVRVAPVGTAAPVDPTVAWGAAWLELGYTNEDGVTVNREFDMEEKAAWQSFYPIRRIVTGRGFTVAFNLYQWNETSVPLAFGGGTITTIAGPPAHYKYTPPSAEVLDERALGVQWQDGTKVYRLIIPRGMVTEAGETNLTRTDTSVLPITFGVVASGTADPFYILTSDPAFAA